jgi:intein/homing endonuclease
MKIYNTENYIKAKEEYLNTDKTLREICKIYHLDRFTFSNTLKTEGVIVKRKLDVDDTLFESIDNPFKAYWLGFLYADGNVTYNLIKKKYSIELCLSEKDLDHLEKYKNFLKISKSVSYRNNTKSYRLTFQSKKVCEDLIKLGCTPKKSLTLKFPEFLSEDLVNHFIRGYFDGDGSISISNKNGRLLSTSLLGTKEFLTSIIEILNIDIKSLKKDKRHKNNTFYIKFNIKDSFKFYEFIYLNNYICLDRKYNKYCIAVEHRNMLNYQRTKTVKGEIPNTVLN